MEENMYDVGVVRVKARYAHARNLFQQNFYLIACPSTIDSIV